MIAVVGSRDMRIGFGLAGVKNTYNDMKKIRGEKIIIAENSKLGEGDMPNAEDNILVKVSVTEDISEIPESFIKQVIGANVIVK